MGPLVCRPIETYNPPVSVEATQVLGQALALPERERMAVIDTLAAADLVLQRAAALEDTVDAERLRAERFAARLRSLGIEQDADE